MAMPYRVYASAGMPLAQSKQVAKASRILRGHGRRYLRLLMSSAWLLLPDRLMLKFVA
jgi:hypothetical protein